MPTYQYACTACDGRLEVVQKFTDDPLTECSVCGGRLRKVFSPVGIVFKGSGFYRTDSRNGSGSGKDISKQNETAATSSDTPAAASAGGDSKASGGPKPKKKAETASAGSAATKAA